MKKRRNSKLKNNILNNISKESIPSFLTTKHFYKRRYSQLTNITNQNIDKNKIEPKLSFTKLYTKSPETINNDDNNENRHNSIYLTGKNIGFCVLFRKFAPNSHFSWRCMCNRIGKLTI